MVKKISFSWICSCIICIYLIYFILQRQLFPTERIIIKSNPANDYNINITLIEDELLKKFPDRVIFYKKLKTEMSKDVGKINTLEKIKKFWKDSLKVILPYYYYLGEEALLINSEKKLLSSSVFFYEIMKKTRKEEFKKWFALQAKRYLERIIKINPDNDSAVVLLGGTLLFGSLSESPMQPVKMIKTVVEKDSNFILGQSMLGLASYYSKQYEKAIYRLLKVARANEEDTENLLLLADCFEKVKMNKKALKIYKKLRKIIKSTEFINMLDDKIKLLENKN